MLSVPELERATPEELAEACDDPIWYAENILGAELWEKPREILDALAVPRARIAIKGCHRSSKTWTLAQAVPWFVATGGYVLTTAPGGDQVENIWTDIRKAHARARVPLGGEMQTHQWKDGQNTLALGRSTNRAERIQGGNKTPALIVCDEAPGIIGDIFEGIEGIRSGGDVRIVMLGNPTRLGGTFYDCFHDQRDSWRTFTISAFDTPNLAGITMADLERMSIEDARRVATKRPYLASIAWVKEKLTEWGPLDPRFQSRVLGQFPTQGKSSLYFLTHLENAEARETDNEGRELDTDGLWAGIDPAGEGSDETAITIREGCHVRGTWGWGTGDGWEQAKLKLMEHGGPGAFECVTVDADGLGYGLAKMLEDAGYRVTHFHAQNSAKDAVRFNRAKDEIHWLFRERLEAGRVTGLADPAAVAQLSQIQWRLGKRGLTEVESKEEMRARQVKSPDRAESVVYAFAESRIAPAASGFPSIPKPASIVRGRLGGRIFGRR